MKNEYHHWICHEKIFWNRIVRRKNKEAYFHLPPEIFGKNLNTWKKFKYLNSKDLERIHETSKYCI
jgi:hypothetical protein